MGAAGWGSPGFAVGVLSVGNRSVQARLKGYWRTSGQLPAFIPGRLAHNTHHPVKRAILALVLGVAS